MYEEGLFVPRMLHADYRGKSNWGTTKKFSLSIDPHNSYVILIFIYIHIMFTETESVMMAMVLGEVSLRILFIFRLCCYGYRDRVTDDGHGASRGVSEDTCYIQIMSLWLQRQSH